MPYLDSRVEAGKFKDSLKKICIDTLLVYHKKHGSSRDYYIFWFSKSELQIRKINATGVFEIGDFSMSGLYRDCRIFSFYAKHKREIDSSELTETFISYTSDGRMLLSSVGSHYPYVDIEVNMAGNTGEYHLPYGSNSGLDNSAFHFVRLIESVIYNVETQSYWKEAEKKMKYFPKRYDPKKEKWQKWELNKLKDGDIWDDYYH